MAFLSQHYEVHQRDPDRVHTDANESIDAEDCVLSAKCQCALGVELVLRRMPQTTEVARSQWPLPTTIIMGTLCSSWWRSASRG